MADGKDEVRSLYRDLLANWNARDPAGFAACFAVDGTSVGFDGSTMEGREQIASHLREVFDQHQTPAYVARVKELRLISADAALLRAVVGMVPAGGTDINPAVNAVQSLLAVRQEGQWRIALLQSTPAAFHGRPELGEALTEELRGELRGTD
jgi:uncharacterized protein (TIGR02246 family)